MRGAREGLQLTGRDLTRSVTLRIPTRGADRASRGVRIRGVETETFSEVRVSAKRLSLSGAEALDLDRLEDSLQTRWTIAFRSDVNPNCILVDEMGAEHNIKAVLEIGDRAFLDLRCTTAVGRS